MTKLSEQERHIVVGALRCAIEQYKADVVQFKAAPEASSEGYGRLVAGFETQIKDAQKLLDRLEY